MLNKLSAFIRQYALLQPGDTVYCAVSGGADSMALLWAMYLLREKLDIRLRAAHFNHHLRGSESDRDEAHVRFFCDRHSIPLTVGEAQVKSGEKGLEAAAREARYTFFETLPGKVATAHTANDNAETVLMHMLRGTGLKGLGGIAPVRGRFIRPMLGVTRAQVLAFLEEYHVVYVQDSSNAGDEFLRNRLRHRVMPLLYEENPRLAENLSQMAMRLREDEQALTPSLPQENELNVPALRSLPKAIRGRMLGAFLERCGVKEPQASHIALAESLVFSENPSARASFPGGTAICRSYDTLVPCHKLPPIPCTPIPCPGTVEFAELGFRVTCQEAQDITNTRTCFTIRPVGQIALRSRQIGDEIRLGGGTKSLKKLFIDKKIPAPSRAQIPVLADDAGVLGVFGFGANLDRTANTLPAVQISLEPINTMHKEKGSSWKTTF